MGIRLRTASKAKLVLPTPPVPTKVNTRQAGLFSLPSSSATNASRPIKVVGVGGKLWRGDWLAWRMRSARALVSAIGSTPNSSAKRL